MPRYYCDYCDTYLTHDSPSVRKQHNAGYKHKANVRTYYQQFEEQQTQSLIDQRIKEHLGQAAVFQQVGAAFNQHLMSLQANPQRPRLPIIPSPVLPIGAPPPLMTTPMVPGVRTPVLPRPFAGIPGYPGAPAVLQSAAPPGANSMPMQMTTLPMPPNLAPPASGAATAPATNVAPAMYHADPSVTLTAPVASTTTAISQDSF